jgi:hypothetical protein
MFPNIIIQACEGNFSIIFLTLLKNNMITDITHFKKCTIPQRNLYVIFFSLSTCLLYLNLFDTNFEVFPYWLLLFFFNKIRINEYLVLTGLSILGFLNQYLYPESRAFIDAIQIISLFMGIIFFNQLERREKFYLRKIFLCFIVINFFVMLFEYFNPEFQDFITNHYANRGNVAEMLIESRNHGVTGLSPEPSYGASLIMALTFASHQIKKLKMVFLPVIFFQMIMFKSLLGFAYLSFFLSTYFLGLIKTKRNIFNLSAFALLLLISILITLRLDIFTRAFMFIEDFNNGGLKYADFNQGSYRMLTLLNSMSFFNKDYETSFSLFSRISNLFHSVFISYLLLLFISLNKRYNFNDKSIFIFFYFLGSPIILWPFFVGSKFNDK